MADTPGERYSFATNHNKQYSKNTRHDTLIVQRSLKITYTNALSGTLTGMRAGDAECAERHLICQQQFTLAEGLMLFQDGYGIRDGFFVGFFAVFIDLSFIFLAVGEATGAADTAAGAGHAFNEVFFEQAA